MHSIHRVKSIPSSLYPIIKSRMDSHGCFDIVASGVSMYPFIQNGDICRFDQSDPNEFRLGDVGLFAGTNGQFVGHRLVAFKDAPDGRRQFVFKGDSNRCPDRPVAAESVLGKLVWMQRGARRIHINRWRSRMWTWAILRVTPFSLGVRRCVIYRQIWEHRITRLRVILRGSSHRK